MFGRQVFIEKNFYRGKLFTGKSDESSRQIRHFSPIRCLMFDFSPRFLGKYKPVSQIQTIKFYFGVSFDFTPSTLSAISENFQKKFRFITATDFRAPTLMKLNSTMMFFLGVLQIELEHYFTYYLRAIGSMLRIFITSCPYLFL